MAATLAQLASRARELANKTGSSFVTDATDSVYGFLNDGARRLHGLIVPAFGDYFERSVTILPAAKIAGTFNDYALPADFYKLLGVDIGVEPNTRTLKPYTRAERNTAALGSGVLGLGRLDRPRYKLSSAVSPVDGAVIRFQPDITERVRVWYVRAWEDVTDPILTVVNFPNNWERSYLPLFAAIRMLQKGDEDASEYKPELQKLEGEIKDACAVRDDGQAPQATDADSVDADEWGDR